MRNLEWSSQFLEQKLWVRGSLKEAEGCGAGAVIIF